MECVTSSNTAHPKMIQLITKSFLFVIASVGAGNLLISIFAPFLVTSSFLKAKYKKITDTIRLIPAARPVFDRKSKNEKPSDVPMIMFGGSPHIVALPPKFAQNISDSIIGTGLNLRS